MNVLRRRRIVLAVILLIGLAAAVFYNDDNYVEQTPLTVSDQKNEPIKSSAFAALNDLTVKGRAPKTGYTRAQFGDGWSRSGGCDTRNIILNRDMKDVEINDSCQVTTGLLDDPYTGKEVSFTRGPSTSADVQIDHVVALSNAWQTGAQGLTFEQRVKLANDPLELLAVDGPANQQKSDGDAATWLPPNKSFRCQYIARQIAVKQKYGLWVVAAEKEAMIRVLSGCPEEALPG